MKKKIPIDRQHKIRQVAYGMFSKVNKQELAYLVSWLLTLYGMTYRRQGKEETYELLWDAAAQLDACEHTTGDPMSRVMAENAWNELVRQELKQIKNGRTPDSKG